jgi:2-polyprenyl-6-methoxyphenol hydroxylase-like FAD-dependent oxidoreductase
VLGSLLAAARRDGRDLGSLEVLQPYETEHRRETIPIYLGTNAVVGLFTDDGEPARLLRQAVIRVADRLPPLKSLITQRLTRSSPTPWPRLPTLPSLPTPPTLSSLQALWRGRAPT